MKITLQCPQCSSGENFKAAGPLQGKTMNCKVPVKCECGYSGELGIKLETIEAKKETVEIKFPGGGSN